MAVTTDQHVAVLGAGTMGSGIAQVAATAGFSVTLRDVGADELERGRAAIRASLARFVKSEQLTAAAAEDVLSRIQSTESLEGAVVDADVVIEAVPEILALKQDVFGQVVEHARPGTLLATNTSQFSISAIGA